MIFVKIFQYIDVQCVYVRVCACLCACASMSEHAGQYPVALLVSDKIWHNKILITAERWGEKYELNYNSIEWTKGKKKKIL